MKLKPGMGNGPPQAGPIGNAAFLASLSAILPQMVKLLQPHFLSSSYAQPPTTQGGTGNRTLAVSNQAPETQLVKLTHGLATIAFQNSYSNPPIVQITPVVPTGSANTNPLHLYGCVSTAACVVQSGSNADERQVHVTIFQNTSMIEP